VHIWQKGMRQQLHRRDKAPPSMTGSEAKVLPVGHMGFVEVAHVYGT